MVDNLTTSITRAMDLDMSVSTAYVPDAARTSGNVR
jgi:hypothetical protein